MKCHSWNQQNYSAVLPSTERTQESCIFLCACLWLNLDFPWKVIQFVHIAMLQIYLCLIKMGTEIPFSMIHLIFIGIPSPCWEEEEKFTWNLPVFDITVASSVKKLSDDCVSSKKRWSLPDICLIVPNPSLGHWDSSMELGWRQHRWILGPEANNCAYYCFWSQWPILLGSGCNRPEYFSLSVSVVGSILDLSPLWTHGLSDFSDFLTVMQAQECDLGSSSQPPSPGDTVLTQLL